MKLSAFVFAILCALTPVAASAARADERVQTPENRYIALQWAHDFSVGDVGMVGPSSGELEMRAILQRPDADAIFVRILSDERSAGGGKLYALLGLRWSNSALFQAHVTRFLRDQSAVMYWSGCLGGPATVGEMAGSIELGIFQSSQDSTSGDASPSLRLARVCHQWSMSEPVDLRDPFVLSRRR